MIEHTQPPSSMRAVVVVNFGSSALLRKNLLASTTSDQLVVVVDSWSCAREREAVLTLADHNGWIVVTPDYNTGFGTGMNLGVARAMREGATSLLLLNPDARLHPQAAAQLFAQVEADSMLLLAPRIVKPDGSAWMTTTMDLRLVDGTVASSRHRRAGDAIMEWVSGAVVALSVELWCRVGGFDDDYFLYWEDIDLCRRVHEVGGAVDVDHSIVATHDEGGTHCDGGGRTKSESFYFYNIRNRALYAAKWLSPRDRRRWALATPRAAMAVLLTGGRRQFLNSIRPWRAGVRGIAAAARIAVRSPSHYRRWVSPT